MPYVYYFANQSDVKWLKKKGITTKIPQLVVIGEDEKIVYSQSIDPDANSFKYTLTSIVYNAMALAQKVDKLFSRPQAPLNQVEQLMTEILQADNKTILYYLLPKVAVEEEEGQRDYLSDLQPEHIYYLRLSPAQFSAQWQRLVDTQKPIEQQSLSYINLLVGNVKTPLLKGVYGANESFTEADYRATDYLVKNYNYLKTQNIQIEKWRFYDVLKSMASMVKHKVVPLQQIENTLLMGSQQYVFLLNNPMNFYIKILPDVLPTFFATYFENLQKAGKGNALLGLDKRFEAEGNKDWKFYKQQFAYAANSVAWRVFENNTTDTTKVAQAIEWAKTAVDILPENPLILDTLACLLYAQGDKTTALPIQEKAVTIMEKLVNTRKASKEQLKELEAHLLMIKAK